LLLIFLDIQRRKYSFSRRNSCFSKKFLVKDLVCTFFFYSISVHGGQKAIKRI